MDHNLWMGQDSERKLVRGSIYKKKHEEKKSASRIAD